MGALLGVLAISFGATFFIVCLLAGAALLGKPKCNRCGGEMYEAGYYGKLWCRNPECIKKQMEARHYDFTRVSGRGDSETSIL